MTQVLNLYLDESGSRRPDRYPNKTHNPKWFGIGGILLKEEDKPLVEKLHNIFCNKYNLDIKQVYLHSHEIRQKQESFAFLNEISEGDYVRFMNDLSSMLIKMPVIGIGCVIDQAGYHNRYQEKYRDDIWLLCKTAFSICVERAAKYALEQNKKLRVFVERANKHDDKILESYYSSLKIDGMPFNDNKMVKYQPLKKTDFQKVLYEFKIKYKKSISTQIADLYLYPICRGGYDAAYRPYQILLEARKLINQNIDGSKIDEIGIKYSCFETVDKIKA